MKGCLPLGNLLYAAMVLAGILVMWRVWKLHGRLMALFFCVILLLLCFVCSPAKLETFVLRVLLRLL